MEVPKTSIGVRHLSLIKMPERMWQGKKRASSHRGDWACESHVSFARE